jgi:hypothetical protein
MHEYDAKHCYTQMTAIIQERQKFLLMRVSGPILKITCNKMSANVDVERMSTGFKSIIWIEGRSKHNKYCEIYNTK